MTTGSTIWARAWSGAARGVPEPQDPRPSGTRRPGCQTGGVSSEQASVGQGPLDWRIEMRVASASELHASWPSVDRDPTARAVACCRPISPAIVLGSTQSVVVVDPAAGAGFEIVRRRSGGGAVLVAPDDPVWIDAWVPSGDPLWSADVSGSFQWLGATWATALSRIGLADPLVQGPGPGACTRWSALVCFGGVGVGEVTVAGRKVVGLSQRRNRAGAWFHGACILRWDPDVLLGMLALTRDERVSASSDLADAATGVVDSADGSLAPPTPETVISAFLAALP